LELVLRICSGSSEGARACRTCVARARPCTVGPKMSGLQVELRGGALRIRVRVKPRASKSRISAIKAGMLEVAVAAPPVDGEANAELIRTLAATLGCAKSAIEIVSGPSSRSKLIAIVGFTEAQLLAKLDPAGRE